MSRIYFPIVLSLPIIIIIALCASGCSNLSSRQQQNLSDGLAGIEAAQPRIASDPIAVDALAGAHDYITATVEGDRLPPPTRTPAVIAADSPAYVASAVTAVRVVREEHVASASATPLWAWIVGGLGALLGTTVGISRALPGPGGMIADFAWRMLAPGRHQQLDTERDVCTQKYKLLVNIINTLPRTATINDLRNQAVCTETA